MKLLSKKVALRLKQRVRISKFADWRFHPLSCLLARRSSVGESSEMRAGLFSVGRLDAASEWVRRTNCVKASQTAGMMPIVTNINVKCKTIKMFLLTLLFYHLIDCSFTTLFAFRTILSLLLFLSKNVYPSVGRRETI